MKKKMIALLLAALIVMSLTACGSSETPTENVAAETNTAVLAETTAPTEATAPASAALESSGAIGDYDVQINDFEIVSDYEGKPVILVAFSFTNNSEENNSAIFALNYEAYQNGLQLETAIVGNSSVYNSDDQMKEIQPGTTIDVKVAYLLDSETAPVEFEITEAFAFSEQMIGKTFDIAEGGATELSIAPGADSAEMIGNYSVSIISHRLGEDYEGNKAILIDLGFTNYSDDTTNYSFAIDFTAFQDGIELESAIVINENASNGQVRNVKPGAGLAVTVGFLLTSDTSPVEIEIEEFFGFSGDKIETTIDIAN